MGCRRVFIWYGEAMISRSDSVKDARGPKWVTALLAWFALHRRAMPWRDRPEPYAVWISEMMLQQTQVDTVRPYFDRFMKRFPDVHALACADQDAVLKLWEGLGYYARARNLHLAAGMIVEQHKGRIPQTSASLMDLPGVGPYAAAAIASIAYGEATPSVDGNVLRVMARFRGQHVDIKQPDVITDVRAYLQKRIPASCPGDFNQALMELGALVCRPRNPLCAECPLRPACKAARKGLTAEIPLAPARKRIPHVDMVAVVVRKRGRILLVKRSEDRMLGGLWEFPGGKREASESLADAAKRTCRDVSGIDVTPGPMRCTVKHTYSHFQITLHVFAARLHGGRLCAGEGCTRAQWVSAVDLQTLAMPITARKVVGVLAAEFKK